MYRFIYHLKVVETRQVTLSVVCVTAFDASRLRRTLDSLKNFKGDLELLVICPKDDSLSIGIANQASSSITYRFRVIHDSQVGVYPAMNLGLTNCVGKYVIFWNSGDLSQSNTALSDFISYLVNIDVDWGVAQGSFSWRTGISLTPENIVNFITQSDGYLSHQTIFAKRWSLLDLGGFNEKFRVAADTDAITKLYLTYGKPDFYKSSIVEVEFPEFSGKYHRRGRYENMLICIWTLPFKYKLQALRNALRKEFLYLKKRLVQKF